MGRGRGREGGGGRGGVGGFRVGTVAACSCKVRGLKALAESQMPMSGELSGSQIHHFPSQKGPKCRRSYTLNPKPKESTGLLPRVSTLLSGPQKDLQTASPL